MGTREWSVVTELEIRYRSTFFGGGGDDGGRGWIKMGWGSWRGPGKADCEEIGRELTYGWSRNPLLVGATADEEGALASGAERIEVGVLWGEGGRRGSRKTPEGWEMGAERG